MFMSAILSVHCNKSEDLEGQEVQQGMKGKYTYELIHSCICTLLSVNMFKRSKIIGTGVVMDQETVHGHKLKNDEVALMVKSLTDKAVKHHLYKYDIEVNCFTAWNPRDIVAQ